jgi:hypothetical protein
MFTGKTVFLAGHAKLPKGMAAQNVFDSLTITAEVDVKYGVIVEACCTLTTDHGRAFVAKLLRGHSLHDGIEEMIDKVKTCYLGKAQNALISALRDLYTQYQAHYKP